MIYICKDSELYALRLIDRIIGRVEELEKNYKAGRIVPEFDDKIIRELIEGNYRIIYYIGSEEAISILRVYHGARLLK